MPCDTAGHTHEWPHSGHLYIEGCERYCGYCGVPYPHRFASTVTLRTHVKTLHAASGQTHPNVTSVVAGSLCPQDKGDGHAARPTTQAGENARLPVTQHVVPTNALVAPQGPWSVMVDVHCQLHLRLEAFEAFHLFLWRHILSKPIANLGDLAAASSSNMTIVPEELLDPVVTFINGCGDIIWPIQAASRHHLVKNSRLLQQRYWKNEDSSGAVTGPVWFQDGFMTPELRQRWQETRESNNRSEPLSHAMVINSAIGRMVMMYVSAMLQHSLVDPSGYERAAQVQSADLLGRILEVDQEEVQKGPIGEAMRLNRGKSGKTVEEMVLQYRQETGYKGGLP